MASVTIDHMVSVIVLISALLLTMGLHSQIVSAAILYQRNHQVAVKAANLIDSICLSSGYPENWGQSNSTPLAFGLQDPEAAGYSLSPFALQRLLSSGGDLIYYPKAGMWFTNVSMGQGGFLGVPVAECINYATVAELLGVNGSYGFQLSITPTLSVSVSEVDANPLRLRVEVRGPGLALSGATLNYYLYLAKPGDGQFPSMEIRSGTAQTDSAGSAILEFDPPIDGSQSTYSIIVYAHLSGFVGTGYYSHEIIETHHIIPFIENFEQGTILLAHSWDVHTFPPPVSALFYNATFLLLRGDFKLRPIQIENSTGKINYGLGWPYGRVRVPSDPGILIVTYRKGNDFGIVMMPWGIGTMGVSVKFGDDSSGHDWVATELRQVTVAERSYQVKLALWSLESL